MVSTHHVMSLRLHHHDNTENVMMLRLLYHDNAACCVCVCTMITINRRFKNSCLLVPSGSQTPICYALHSFVLHLAPTVSVLLLLKFGTLSLRLFECVPAMIPSAINSRPTTSSWRSNPLSASSLALTIVRGYKLYLLTYLLILAPF